MLRLLPLTSVFAAIILAACSPTAPAPVPAPPQQASDDRDNIGGAVVQATGDTAEAIRAAEKAEKVATLKKLLERLAKAQTLNDAFSISEEIEDLGKDIKAELHAGMKDVPA